MDIPVIDLHCDLLGCIEHNEKVLHFESPDTNCSIPQLLQGHVRIQTFAIATTTKKGSTVSSLRQVDLFDKMLQRYPSIVTNRLQTPLSTQLLHCLLSVENASGLAEEDEPLEKAFERLIRFSKSGKILYVSLTWNDENRFGGGNASKVGLKPDGKALLDFLSHYNIPVDLSHTSDALAHDILDYIHYKSLHIIPIASHSNFRTIKNIPRNLPDEVAKEIIRLEGLIGINFIRRFVGIEKTDFIKHFEYGVHLAGENSLCFGADFYGGIDDSSWLIPDRTFPIFYPECSNSSCYPHFLTFLYNTFSRELIDKFSYLNAFNLLKRIHISE